MNEDNVALTVENIKILEIAVYKVCKALVDITETECCGYGYDEAIDIAEDYVNKYEEDHPYEKA